MSASRVRIRGRHKAKFSRGPIFCVYYFYFTFMRTRAIYRKRELEGIREKYFHSSCVCMCMYVGGTMLRYVNSQNFSSL